MVEYGPTSRDARALKRQTWITTLPVALADEVLQLPAHYSGLCQPGGASTLVQQRRDLRRRRVGPRHASDASAGSTPAGQLSSIVFRPGTGR